MTTDTAGLCEPSFRRDSLISFAMLAVNFMFALATSVMAARVLGPEGKGLYSLVFTIVGIAASLLSFGTHAANVYFLGTRKYPAGVLVGNSIAYCAAGGLFFMVLLFLAAPAFSPSVIPSAQLGLLYAALPALPLLMFSEHAYYLILARRDMPGLMKFNLVKPVVYLAALSLVFALGFVSVRSVIYANLAGIAAGAAAAVFWKISSHPRPALPRPWVR